MAMSSSSGQDSFTRSGVDSEDDQKLLSDEERDLSGTPPPASSAGPTDNQADADASPFEIRGLGVTGHPAHLERRFNYKMAPNVERGALEGSSQHVRGDTQTAANALLSLVTSDGSQLSRGRGRGRSTNSIDWMRSPGSRDLQLAYRQRPASWRSAATFTHLGIHQSKAV